MKLNEVVERVEIYVDNAVAYVIPVHKHPLYLDMQPLPELDLIQQYFAPELEKIERKYQRTIQQIDALFTDHRHAAQYGLSASATGALSVDDLRRMVGITTEYR